MIERTSKNRNNNKQTDTRRRSARALDVRFIEHK